MSIRTSCSKMRNCSLAARYHWPFLQPNRHKRNLLVGFQPGSIGLRINKGKVDGREKRQTKVDDPGLKLTLCEQCERFILSEQSEQFIVFAKVEHGERCEHLFSGPWFQLSLIKDTMNHSLAYLIHFYP